MMKNVFVFVMMLIPQVVFASSAESPSFVRRSDPEMQRELEEIRRTATVAHLEKMVVESRRFDRELEERLLRIAAREQLEALSFGFSLMGMIWNDDDREAHREYFEEFRDYTEISSTENVRELFLIPFTIIESGHDLKESIETKAQSYGITVPWVTAEQAKKIAEEKFIQKILRESQH